MITIGFVRHGTTDWNTLGRLQGQRDIPLNEAGLWQAERLGERLRGESWDAIVSSDLQRARRTAEIIADKAGIADLRLDARLRERTHGRLDGTTPEERIAAWGPDWKALEHGIESDEALIERGAACLRELADTLAGKRVLVVSHGTYIAVMLDCLLPVMPDGLLRNSSLTVIERAGREQAGAWTCPLFNCTAHLGPEARPDGKEQRLHR